mmetsp:Transcript_8954/g.8696  ORF Transcript_8954/g.8696 Transcript_8954/m.8696 type:complete len:81 (-) Transcript_8954:7-249(-)
MCSRRVSPKRAGTSFPNMMMKALSIDHLKVSCQKTMAQMPTQPKEKKTARKSRTSSSCFVKKKRIKCGEKRLTFTAFTNI